MHILLPVFLVLLFSVFPDAALAQLVACEGPQDCGTCEFAETLQRTFGFMVTLAIIIATASIVLGGLRLATSQGSAEAKSRIKKTLVNIFIGFVLVIAAYAIIDTVLRALLPSDSPILPLGEIECIYQTPPDASRTPFGSTALTADCAQVSATQFDCREQVSACEAQGGTASVNTSNPLQHTVGCSGSGLGVGSGSTGSVGNLQQCPPGNVFCSVDALQRAGFTEEQASIMSCIAITESSGNPFIGPYNERPENAGSNSSACGLFQVVRTTWNSAASGACSDFSKCTDAACNAQVARTLVSRNGYNDWTCAGCNAKAAGCVAQFGN